MGYVPVDEHYRHVRYPEIYAAGIAAHTTATSSVASGVPKTGYLAHAMAKIAAQNMAAVRQRRPTRSALAPAPARPAPH